MENGIVFHTKPFWIGGFSFLMQFYRNKLVKYIRISDIYVYDNNSTDNSYEIAKDTGAIVKREYRQGKGNVVRSMFRDIDADCYILVDGVDSYPAEVS